MMKIWIGEIFAIASGNDIELYQTKNIDAINNFVNCISFTSIIPPLFVMELKY